SRADRPTSPPFVKGGTGGFRQRYSMLKDTSSVACSRAANLPQLATHSDVFRVLCKKLPIEREACYDRLFIRILRTRALSPSPSACAARPAGEGRVRAGR